MSGSQGFYLGLSCCWVVSMLGLWAGLRAYKGRLVEKAKSGQPMEIDGRYYSITPYVEPYLMSHKRVEELLDKALEDKKQ